MDGIVIAAVTIGAAAFRGMTGFGYALVAALGFAGIFSPVAMVPFILINDLMLTAITIFDRGRSPIDWPVARLLLVSGLCGALCGNYLSVFLEDDLARLLVSATIVLAACTALIHNPPAWLANKVLGVVIGAVVGLLLAVFAVGGPLVAAWLLAGGSRRENMRGTLAVFFGVIDLFTLASRTIMGRLGDDLPHLLLVYMPMTFIGFGAGYLLSHRLPAHVWGRVSGVGLVIIAIVGFAQTLYALAFV
jgi:uncharacterized membrane protein YfcA